MAWTQSDLDALETAMKSGVLTVHYSDRTVTYRSMTELMDLREAMKAVIASSTATPRTMATLASFSKG